MTIFIIFSFYFIIAIQKKNKRMAYDSHEKDMEPLQKFGVLSSKKPVAVCCSGWITVLVRLKTHFFVKCDTVLNLLVQIKSPSSREEKCHPYLIQPWLGRIPAAWEALCHSTLLKPPPPQWCLVKCCLQAKSHGKLLKGTQADSLSSSEAAGLSARCEEPRCDINTLVQGPGRPQPAPPDTLRWT